MRNIDDGEKKKKKKEKEKEKKRKYQPSGAGGTRSPPAKSKMADRVWKGVQP